MSYKELYLDHTSSTDINPEVLETYKKVLDKYYANSASIHDLGHEVKRLEDKSRQEILKMMKMDKNYQLIFTSGATEANNLAIKGIAFEHQHQGKEIITTKIEHASVLESCRQLETYFGFKITYLDVDEEGTIDLKQLRDALTDQTILVSIMSVNNEIGTLIQPSAWAKVVKQHSKAFTHVDLVQSLTKIPLDLEDIDLITISAHKLNGVKGSGALIKRDYIKLMPILSGGSQEYHYRAGTTNAPVNIVFAKTLRLAFEDHEKYYDHSLKLYRYLYQELTNIDGVLINSSKEGSPFIMNFSVKNLTSEVLLNAFNNKKIYVSAVSTCNDNKDADSDVLREIGYDKQRRTSSVRVGLSYHNNQNDVDRFIAVLKETIDKYAVKI